LWCESFNDKKFTGKVTQDFAAVKEKANVTTFWVRQTFSSLIAPGELTATLERALGNVLKKY